MEENLKTIIDETKRGYAPHVLEVAHDGTMAQVIALPTSGPAGFSLVLQDVKPFVDRVRTAPERRKGTATLTTLASFIEHVNRFRDEDSAIFVDDDKSNPSVTCVFDYHRKTAAGAPRFGEHRAIYRFPLSDEFVLWRDGAEDMEQRQFARFLQGHLEDVIDPSTVGERTSDTVTRMGITVCGPLRLQELSKGLAIKAEHALVEEHNLATGETKLQFEEKHTDKTGAELKIPGGFVVAVPVFKLGHAYQIPVRLEYRAKGRITWSFAAHRAEDAFAHALAEACDATREQTSLPLFYGSPESAR